MSARAPAVGVRYVLPVVPFLWVIAGCGAAYVARFKLGRAALACLLLVQVGGYATALQASPLAFFNGFFCWTGDTMPCLDDSNLDWGQALPDLARFRAAHYPGVPLRVMYVGSSPVAAYVPDAAVASTDELAVPAPALYAISLYYRARSPADQWTRRLAPSAIVGGVYAIYDLRALAEH
jgi:hypothetical protein